MRFMFFLSEWSMPGKCETLFESYLELVANAKRMDGTARDAALDKPGAFEDLVACKNILGGVFQLHMPDRLCKADIKDRAWLFVQIAIDIVHLRDPLAIRIVHEAQGAIGQGLFIDETEI